MAMTLQTRAVIESAGNAAGGGGTAYDYYYKDKWIKTIGRYLVWAAFAQQEEIKEGWGDNIKMHRLTALTAATTALTEGGDNAIGDIAGQSIVKSTVTIPINQYGTAIYVSDRLEFEDVDPNIEMGAELLAEWAGNVVDLVARTQMNASNTNTWMVTDDEGAYTLNAANDSTVDGTVSKALLEKMVREADIQRMRPWINSVAANDGVGTKPIPKGIPVICSAYHKYDIRNLVGEANGFVPVHMYPREDRIHPAEFGAYDILRFVLTDNPLYEADSGAAIAGITPAILSTTGTYADVYSMFMVGRNAFGSTKILGIDQQEDRSAPFELIYQQLGSGGATGDPLHLVASVGVKFYYGAYALVGEHILQVMTAVLA